MVRPRALESSFGASLRLLQDQFAMPCGASGTREAKKALKNTQAVHRRCGLTGGTGTAVMAGSTTSASSTSAGGGTFRDKMRIIKITYMPVHSTYLNITKFFT